MRVSGAVSSVASRPATRRGVMCFAEAAPSARAAASSNDSGWSGHVREVCATMCSRSCRAALTQCPRPLRDVTACTTAPTPIHPTVTTMLTPPALLAHEGPLAAVQRLCGDRRGPVQAVPAVARYRTVLAQARVLGQVVGWRVARTTRQGQVAARRTSGVLRRCGAARLWTKRRMQAVGGTVMVARGPVPERSIAGTEWLLHRQWLHVQLLAAFVRLWWHGVTAMRLQETL